MISGSYLCEKNSNFAPLRRSPYGGEMAACPPSEGVVDCGSLARHSKAAEAACWAGPQLSQVSAQIATGDLTRKNCKPYGMYLYSSQPNYLKKLYRLISFG